MAVKPTYYDRIENLERYCTFATHRIKELEHENGVLRQMLYGNVSKSTYKRLQIQLSATKSVF